MSSRAGAPILRARLMYLYPARLIHLGRAVLPANCSAPSSVQ
ncbi:hypothetical protein ACNUDN_29655 [Mycobacterium sp. smrl_JER01]